MAAAVRLRTPCTRVCPLLNARREEMMVLDQKIGVLMRLVLRCKNIGGGVGVEADIHHVYKKIGALCDATEKSAKVERNLPGWKTILAGVDVLFLNVCLVKHHAARLKEFACMSDQVGQIWRMIARYELLGEAQHSSAVAHIQREFRELDLSFVGMMAGFSVRQLIPCQTERFEFLRMKMDDLRVALLDLKILTSDE